MRAISIAAIAAFLARAALAAPSISTFSPAKDATSIHPRANVVMTFDEAVEAKPAMLIELRRVQTDYVISAVAAVSSFVTVSGATVTVMFPVSDLPTGDVYVSIEAGAFVAASGASPFVGITDKSWKFSIDGETRLAATLSIARMR